MFTRRQVGNPRHARDGKFSGSDYKITLRRKRLSKIFILELAVLTALFVWLCDLTAEKVANALYPQINPVEAHFEPQVAIEDYVLDQVEQAGIDKYKVYMLLHCENINWDTEATLNNGQYGIDRGLWQLNSHYHSEVTNSCAYDYKCATKEAIRILQERGFGEWTCGKNL